MGNIEIKKDFSLKNYHSFGIDIKAKYFIELQSIEAIEEFVESYKDFTPPIYFLGGGTNTLFTDNYEGTVVHIYNQGIELLAENDNDVLIQVSAGETWDDFVLFCVEHEYYGIENLSAIPGQVGTAPIQNIGAYGVEAKDCIDEVTYINLENKDTYIIQNQECKFGYRDSIFKHELKDKIIITEVVFRLSKQAKLNLEYGAIKNELTKKGIDQPNIEDVSQIIRHIRATKLPDHTIVGNAGSFFKNPIIDKVQYDRLIERYPDLVSYPIDNNNIKIASGWLIDHLGWKGREHHGAAVHQNQALVLINNNKATGEAVSELASLIQKDVLEAFDIQLEPEVNIL